MTSNLFKRFPEGIKKMEQNFGNAEFSRFGIDLRKIEEQIGSDTALRGLLENTRGSFFEYVEILLTLEEFLSKNPTFEDREVAEENARIDEWRKRAHDAMIDNVAILARNLKKQNIDASWIEKVGPTTNRAGYARLALATAFNELREQKPEAA